MCGEKCILYGPHMHIWSEKSRMNPVNDALCCICCTGWKSMALWLRWLEPLAEPHLSAALTSVHLFIGMFVWTVCNLELCCDYLQEQEVSEEQILETWKQSYPQKMVRYEQVNASPAYGKSLLNWITLIGRPRHQAGSLVEIYFSLLGQACAEIKSKLLLWLGNDYLTTKLTH